MYILDLSLLGSDQSFQRKQIFAQKCGITRKSLRNTQANLRISCKSLLPLETLVGTRQGYIDLGIKHFPLQIKRCGLPLFGTKVLTTEHMLGCLFTLKLTTLVGREQLLSILLNIFFHGCRSELFNSLQNGAVLTQTILKYNEMPQT